MKAISYAIFRGDCEEFEFKAYLRGLYFNLRMNSLIYPDWVNVITIEIPLYSGSMYERYFDGLESLFKVNFIMHKTAPLCEMMLWRIAPAFSETAYYSHVICRDSDAITTYREAQYVQDWIDINADAHGMNDNAAHTGLMGGMVGFKTEVLRNHFQSFNNLIHKFDLSKRGSDQHLLNQRIYPVIKNSLVRHNGTSILKQIPGVDPKLWQSNLCASFIGAPGFNELETLRFFKRFDKNDYSAFEKEFKEICYWKL